MSVNCHIVVTATVKGDIATIWDTVKKKGAAKKIKFTGNPPKDPKGTFTNDVSGTYSVEGQTITVVVLKKPGAFGVPLVKDEEIKAALEAFFVGL
jgi:hypothetical protein